MTRHAARLPLLHAALAAAFMLIGCGAEEEETPPPPPPPTETPVVELPAAPANLGASRTDLLQVTLFWDDLADNEDEFEVRRMDVNPDGSAGRSLNLARQPANTSTYTDATVACEAVYQYYIVARNAAGLSEEICLLVQMPSDCNGMAESLVTAPCP